MAAMRLASNQQLAHDCLTGVGSSDRRDGDNSPTIESLMTLLWATHVFEKRRQALKLDVATEVRQACRQLKTSNSTSRTVSFLDLKESRQKSLEEWRSALP